MMEMILLRSRSNELKENWMKIKRKPNELTQKKSDEVFLLLLYFVILIVISIHNFASQLVPLLFVCISFDYTLEHLTHSFIVSLPFVLTQFICSLPLALLSSLTESNKCWISKSEYWIVALSLGASLSVQTNKMAITSTLKNILALVNVVANNGDIDAGRKMLTQTNHHGFFIRKRILLNASHPIERSLSFSHWIWYVRFSLLRRNRIHHRYGFVSMACTIR